MILSHWSGNIESWLGNGITCPCRSHYCTMAKRIRAFRHNPVMWADRSCFKHHKRKALLLNSTADLLSTAFRKTCILLRIYIFDPSCYPARCRSPSDITLATATLTSGFNSGFLLADVSPCGIRRFSHTKHPAWYNDGLRQSRRQRRPGVLVGHGIRRSWYATVIVLECCKSTSIKGHRSQRSFPRALILADEADTTRRLSENA